MNGANLNSQTSESPLKLFGYFQNSFQHWTSFREQQLHNSFSLQQLNIFLQKDLTKHWTAFINLEFLNNFSSNRQWGAANLEEAWIKYRYSMKFNIKLGLQIPIFNNFNEIKNRTPLIPYIVRPLVYETSFSDFIPVDEFVPARAFIQTYGFFPFGLTKVDYAVYLGNSPNINNLSEGGQTGIDTTTTFLVGGRVGLRYRELKFGFSSSYEKDNKYMDYAEAIGKGRFEFEELPKWRLGGDLSYNYKKLFFEGEFISVDLEEGTPDMELALDFYYFTLGYNFTDYFLIYGSYWVMDSYIFISDNINRSSQDGDILTLNLGLSYDLNDRIRLKGQFARVKNSEEFFLMHENIVEIKKDNFSVYALAVSVFF
jgi:hypothetical protein